jgi:DNA-binding MarR family transcriptional regulator
MAESTVAAEQRVLPLIDRLARLARRAADARFSAGSGYLRPRHVIALRLLHERGPMPQHDLGEALCLDPSNVVGLLNELEERGLITRRRDPADRRRHIVELSTDGAAELAATDVELGLIEDDLLKALSPQERVTLHALLAQAVGAASPTWGSAKCAADGPSAEPPPSCLAR